ncbi:MAG: NAD(P)/FAD-dependent oxidoreductase [Phycisphaerales bacterium]|nr:NAD(P)/FAD-dependent oxidoreductase [Phycisphaerales bacterium]
MPDHTPQVGIIGAGAAGLMCAIMTARECRLLGVEAQIVLLDGAKKIGAKILVAGGGRCNVTHHRVLPNDYAGASRNAIKKVLKAFNERATIEFFENLGVRLKQEDTGKMFPVSDSAQSVLSALLDECDRLGIAILHPWRVGRIQRDQDRFVVTSTEDRHEPKAFDCVVLATGGMALPKTGSDGAGYRFAQSLGHSVTQRVFPALVPLVVDQRDSWLMALSGISTRATLEVHSGTGKRLAAFTNEVLCTHFGLSGPGVLDISRWYLDARQDDADASLVINWLGETSFEQLDQQLQSLGKKTVLGFLRESIPDRLARALCEQSDVEPSTPGHALSRDQRRLLGRMLTQCPIAIERDRGFTFAEVTAGGIPLTEISTSSMGSRACEGLWIIGEILDVDGRIGGFNFQWAWASGTVAGRSIARSIAESIAT